MSVIPIAKFSEAQAVAICWMAGFRGPIKPAGWDGLHCEECGWCDYPQDVKLASVAAFDLRDDADRQRAAFFAAPAHVRRATVRKAQGYPERAA